MKQKRIKKVISIILTSAVLTACGSGKTDQTTEPEQTLRNDASETDTGSGEISMEEAVGIAMSKAEKYYDNLQLTEVHSYDNDSDPDIQAGSDGTRQYWYVNFANEDMNYVCVLVADGRIELVEPLDSQGNNGLLNMEDVHLTAREAAKKAQEIGLRGGDPDCESEWVSGYNFSLSWGTLEDDPEERKMLLEVIGISPDGNFAHVDFDAATGEVLLAEEKLEYKSGDAEWKEMDY